MLEYCSPVWSPYYIGNISKLESVQRTFTKRLTGMRSLSYDNRLKALGLERLELRRLHMDYLLKRDTWQRQYPVRFILLSLARIKVLAVIRLSNSILILVYLFAHTAFLSELLCFESSACFYCIG